VDAVARHEHMARQKRLELPAKEQIDPDEQDRGHAPDTTTPRVGR
jgi:hypothetical protein